MSNTALANRPPSAVYRAGVERTMIDRRLLIASADKRLAAAHEIIQENLETIAALRGIILRLGGQKAIERLIRRRLRR